MLLVGAQHQEEVLKKLVGVHYKDARQRVLETYYSRFYLQKGHLMMMVLTRK